MTSVMVMQGRQLSGADIGLIRGLLDEHPDWGRSRLSVEICERWAWRNAQGRPKDMAARTLLLKLERAGHIRLPPRRGREAMDAAGILPEYRGCAVHDFWDSYMKYGCDHAFCNGHLLRELIFLWEEQDQKWAKKMIDHLLAIKETVDSARDAGQTALPNADQDRFLKRYERIVEAGYAQNPVAPPVGSKRRGRRKQTKARNLLDRFRDHSDGILAFMRNFSIPFDNNLSERDLRMMKLRQKISGTFRNFDALVDFCRIRGYVSTARKNGLNALDALRRVFLGNPFVPALNTS